MKRSSAVPAFIFGFFVAGSPQTLAAPPSATAGSLEEVTSSDLVVQSGGPGSSTQWVEQDVSSSFTEIVTSFSVIMTGGTTGVSVPLIGYLTNQNNTLILVPLFLFSLLTYKLHDAVFSAWVRFAAWGVPGSILLILIASDSHQGGGLGGRYFLHSKTSSVFCFHVLSFSSPLLLLLGRCGAPLLPKKQKPNIKSE